MTANKRVVEAYMEAFGRTDHAAILDCLTEDVEWLIPECFTAAARRRSTAKSKMRSSRAARRSVSAA